MENSSIGGMFEQDDLAYRTDAVMKFVDDYEEEVEQIMSMGIPKTEYGNDKS